jgi:hypothetical protein
VCGGGGQKSSKQSLGKANEIQTFIDLDDDDDDVWSGVHLFIFSLLREC